MNDPAGRAARAGSEIECPLCDSAELPEGLAVVRRLGPWDGEPLPDALRRAHRTPEATWGRLWVREGAVGFQFRPDGTPPGELLNVPAGSCQSIPPGVTHRVVAEGPVRLELELLAPAGH